MTSLVVVLWFILGFLAGWAAKQLSKPRCPELKPVKVRSGWTGAYNDVRRYKEVLCRCELKDLHDGPCLISKDVDHPVHWNPEDEEEYLPSYTKAP